MVVQNIFKFGQSEWEAPIVLAARKSGRFFCVYYLKLNAVGKRGSNTILHLDKCIDLSEEETVSSTIHGDKVYWKVKMDKSDGEWKSFTLRRGLYCFMSIYFCLRSTSGTL